MTKEEIEQATGKIVAQFETGDLSPIREVARIQLPPDAPARRWSFTNQCLVYLLFGQVGCSGFRQWLDVERWVRRDETADAFIWIHYIYESRTRRDKDGRPVQEDGFRPVKVFSYQKTDGKPIAEYEPRELPPLMEVARQLGIDVAYVPTVGCNGSCTTDGKEIHLGVHDPRSFWHELGHAADAHFNGKLVPVGSIGTGYTVDQMYEIKRLVSLGPVVIAVTAQGLTEGGQLWLASFDGVRDDKAPEDCALDGRPPLRQVVEQVRPVSRVDQDTRECAVPARPAGSPDQLSFL